MVKKTSYLSEPQHLRISNEVSKLRVENLSQIVNSENCYLDYLCDMPMENNYEYAIDYYYGWEVVENSDKKKRISLREVFSRLEEIEAIELSEKNGFFGFNTLTALLCDVIGIDYNIRNGEIFHRIAHSFLDCSETTIAWTKEESEFQLTIYWGTALEKTFKAGSLVKCFEEADKFLSC